MYNSMSLYVLELPFLHFHIRNLSLMYDSLLYTLPFSLHLHLTLFILLLLHLVYIL